MVATALPCIGALLGCNRLSDTTNCVLKKKLIGNLIRNPAFEGRLLRTRALADVGNTRRKQPAGSVMRHDVTGGSTRDSHECHELRKQLRV